MQAVADGRLEISDDFVEHMYCCVGCRACETACPSGVQFGKLIEAAREQIQVTTKAVAAQQGSDRQATDEYTLLLGPTTTPTEASLAAKLLRSFFFDFMLPSRPILSLVFGGLKLYQRLGLQTLVHSIGLLDIINALPTPFQGQIKVPEELMASAAGPVIPTRLPAITPAIGPQRYRVGFISGCIMDQVFHEVNEATIRVLAANGCEVITPVQQNCCGALHVHAGEADSGRSLARHNIDVFEKYGCDVIIINSAGCGSTLKEYDHLLRDDPAYSARAEAFSRKVKDVGEFLASSELNPDMGSIAHTVVYHDACHLAHGQKIKQQPRKLLRSIPGITLVDLKESDWCCGSAGIYNLTNQEMAAQLLERKMNNVAATGANIIATGNPGCTMQIAMGVRQRGLDMQVMHPIQLLDEAYQAGGKYDVPVSNEVEKTRQRALIIGGSIVLLIIAILLGRQRKNT